MNHRYLYLVLDILTIIFPVLFSFHRKTNFYLRWKYVFAAGIIVAVPFVAWDIWFTAQGVWSFNPKYVTGVYVGNLPIEEVLFFICIPFACTFSYEAASYLPARERLTQPMARRISAGLVVVLLLVALAAYPRAYTTTTCALTGGFIGVLYLLRADYLAKFYWAFIFILLPFFIVNGILTGTGIDEPVVRYNDAENLGWRIGTIPPEDAFYGMLLILMNISFFELLQWKFGKKALA